MSAALETLFELHDLDVPEAVEIRGGEAHPEVPRPLRREQRLVRNPFAPELFNTPGWKRS